MWIGGKEGDQDVLEQQYMCSRRNKITAETSQKRVDILCLSELGLYWVREDGWNGGRSKWT